jgi:hypothetical protein
MKPSASVSNSERDLLRGLASQVAEIAAQPVQQETIRLWKALNGLRPVRPMVMIDQICWHELEVDEELALQTESEFCRGLERGLRRTLYQWRHMRADMVVSPYVEIPKVIRGEGFGIQVVERAAVLDPRNDVYGHAYIDQVATDDDLRKIRTPELSLDEEATAEAEEKAHHIFEGVLQVRMQGRFPTFAPWDVIATWRSPEHAILDLIDRPEFMHRLVSRLTEVYLSWLDQLEAQGLLGWGQSLIHCTGAWSEELPAPGAREDHPRARDLWTYGMAQVFSTVSPAMHKEFWLDYATKWFARFGLGYYGCCEPLDRKIGIIRGLPNVRKISMSPWVEVERGAAELRGDYVFSRKPSPALLASETWDPGRVEQDLRATLEACARHACPVELILKDISTVRYQPQRLWEWAEVAKRVTQG